MTAKITRILKEARPLLWPWCAVVMVGALPLVHPLHWVPNVSVIGYFAGILGLATLPFGNEFEHRTLSLLLSQPVGRMEIWGEKLIVTVIAILSAGLVLSLALRATSFHLAPQEIAFAGAWIVAGTASATFWTLFTRSTVGGVALNIGVQSFLCFVIPWANLTEGLRARGYLAPGSHLVVSTITFVFLCYVGGMVWLGGRTLARLQATGGMGSDDLLMAGPDVLPGAWAGWLRCRPTGAVLNLIRKELRLLRPVWLISLLAALCWACLALYALLFEQGYSKNFETAVVIVGVVSTLMIAILAGSMSLGEERTSGTHAWHLTLPVPSRLQWLIKLCVALFASFVGAWLPPTLIDWHFRTYQLVVVLLLTFAAFWCACAVEGTVAAVLWVIPVTSALGCAGYFAFWFGHDLMFRFYSSRFDPFTSLRFACKVAKIVNGPEYDYRHVPWFVQLEQPMAYVALAGGSALLLALIQSYRLFCVPLQNSTRSLVRHLLPLAMLVFLCSFSLTAFNYFMGYPRWQVVGMFGATRVAIQKILPAAAKLDPTQPLHLTVDDLAKALKTYPFLLSENSRRWLRDARITVTPDKAHPNGFFCKEGQGGQTWCYYSATIHLADGTDLTQSWEPEPNHPAPGRYSIYARWPGAAGQELLWGW